MALNWLQMSALSLAQGLGSVFPLSASGLSVIARKLLGLPLDGSVDSLYTGLMQLAVVLTACVVFRRELAACLAGLTGRPAGRDPQLRERRQMNSRLFMLTLVAVVLTLPALLFRRYAGSLTGNLPALAALLTVNGFVLFFGDRVGKGSRKVAEATVADGVCVGLAQALAVVPGLSRTGLTVTAGLARGLDPEFCFRFSFLAGLPALLIQAIASVAGAGQAFQWSCLLGMALTALAAYGALALLRTVLRRGGTGNFAYASWCAGLLTFVLYLLS